MGVKNKNIFYLLVAVGLMTYSCVEPYEFESDFFDSAVVVEGTLTDETKNHEIMLSRTYRLEEEGTVPLNNADVKVIDDTGRIYSFEERSPGNYFSAEKFKAEEGRSYQLEFTTESGRNYSSDPAQFSGTAIIEDIYARPKDNIEGEPGVEILLDSRGNPGSGGYYRYEYIETYKFVSYMNPNADVVQVDDFVELVPKTKEEYTCFRSRSSQEIIVDNTTSQSSNRTTALFLRFIPRTDPVFARRYSILVIQYGLSREAYTFYQSLKDLSESESLFSQLQPGFLAGNIYSLNDPEENVIGFFSVSSVSEKRVYFNYEDFYNDNDGPRPYFHSVCPLKIPTTVQELLEFTNDASLKFYEFIPAFGPPRPNQFVFVRAVCVDCTLTGTNEVPVFWEDY